MSTVSIVKAFMAGGGWVGGSVGDQQQVGTR
jgi:hypothetical protein